MARRKNQLLHPLQHLLLKLLLLQPWLKPLLLLALPLAPLLVLLPLLLLTLLPLLAPPLMLLATLPKLLLTPLPLPPLLLRRSNSSLHQESHRKVAFFRLNFVWCPCGGLHHQPVGA